MLSVGWPLTAVLSVASTAGFVLLWRERRRAAALETANARQQQEMAQLADEVRGHSDRARRARDQRDGLVRAAVHLAANLQSRALQDTVDTALHGAGVELLTADGRTFDPLEHRAVRRLPVTDRTRDGTVAETLRTGYRDGGHVLRPADVAVFEFMTRAETAPAQPEE
jgi:molecular chaperone GrpE (heat shock protein)